MKKVFLFFVIILSAFNTYASSQWIFITDNTVGDLFFIDANSIQKSGDSYTVWQKTNFGKRDRWGNLSSKAQKTINCRTRENTFRYLQIYDDIDNNGQLTNSIKAKDDWYPIAPDSVDWIIYKYVCNK